MTIVAPSMMPVAFAANANLFVSAENSQFDNYMSGPQVIEVVVIDSDINDTDQGKGEPDVTVNGKILRMVQAVDGNWYGYFADRNMAQIADSTATIEGEGLDFGSFCSATTASRVLGISLTETSGVAIANQSRALGDLEIGNPLGGVITASCVGQNVAGGLSNNVVREAKDPNTNSNVPIGQIGLNKTLTAGNWPFVQLYSLNPTGNVVIQYAKGGGVQSTTLTFDSVDQFASASLDRTKYPQGAEIHATITDLWLNIDPTDEDSWTFGGNSSNTQHGTYYQIFDENGKSDGDQKGAVFNIKSKLSALMCEDNCLLNVNPNVQGAAKNVLTLQDNDDSVIILNGTNANLASKFQLNNTYSGVGGSAQHQKLGINTVPVTITEQGPNSGVFGTYDESDTSVLKITSDAARGTSASIDYNETPVTVLVGFDFATVDIQPTDDEWNSGEEIPVIIVDGDANKNSRADEDLDLNIQP